MYGRLISMFIIIFFLCSCGYLEDRVRDTADIMPISFSAGPGLYAGMRATAFLGTGIGYADVYRAGTQHRVWFTDTASSEYYCVTRAWKDRTRGWFFAWSRNDDPVEGAGNRMYPDFRNTGFLSWSIISLEPVIEDPSSESGFQNGGSGAQLLDVEMDVHAGLIGARIGLSPLQMVDWLLGWFTLDIGGDDENKIMAAKRREAEEQKKEKEKEAEKPSA